MAFAKRAMMEVRRYVRSHHPLVRNIPPSLRAAVYIRCALSHEHKYIYVRVPKAANSTVSKALAWLSFPDERTAIEADDRGRTAKHTFSQLPWRWFSVEQAQNYFKFIFVRDPFTRTLSAYLDKINPGFDRPGFVKVGKHFGKRTSELSFGDFVTYLETGGLHGDIHWAPQVDICPFPVRSLDLIGRIENLDADLEKVRLNVFNAPMAVKRERTSRRTNSTEKLLAYYQPDLVNRVANLYRRDFVAFGYNPDGPIAGS